MTWIVECAGCKSKLTLEELAHERDLGGYVRCACGSLEFKIRVPQQVNLQPDLAE